MPEHDGGGSQHGAALVTGGANRIGRALALALGERGFDVVVHHHRSTVAAEEVASAIRVRGRQSIALAADLADPAACRGLFETSRTALGPVRLLINNAAVFELDRPDSVTDESWARHMAINLHAPFLLAQAMHRHVDDGHGMVVNLTDQRVLRPTPNFTSYTTSKIALDGLTRHLALALAPRLRVNAIAPGVVLAGDRQDDDAGRLAEVTPLQRATALDEIVAALSYLLDASSVTGSTLVIDSGMHLGRLPRPGAGTR